MKHCYITPTEFINTPEIGWKSDFLLVLSHLLNEECDNKYAIEVQKFAETGKKLYLDNGLFENNEPEDADSLLRKAVSIWVEYVFSPDVLFDRKATEIQFDYFEKRCKEMWYKWKIAYVVQAKDPLDYINAYKWAENNDRIDMIWLSILSIPKSFQNIVWWNDITFNRVVCLKILQDFINPQKDAHLLWLWDGLWDIIEWWNYNYIKSNDTSSAFQNWLFKKWYIEKWESGYPEVDGGKVKDKVNFDLQRSDIDDIQYDQIVRNVLDFKKLIW